MPNKKPPRVPGVKPGDLGGKPITKRSQRPLALGTVDPESYDTEEITNGETPQESGGRWQVSAKVEEEADEASETVKVEKPADISYFELTVLRPDPDILNRQKRGWRLRQSDWWNFAFEGSGEIVSWQSAILKLTVTDFASEEKEERIRERRKWIALHFLARTSPVLVACKRQDAPRTKPAPIRSLNGMIREKATSILARDLHFRKKSDVGFVRETLDLLQVFSSRINAQPKELLSRQVVNKFLFAKFRNPK